MIALGCLPLAAFWFFVLAVWQRTRGIRGAPGLRIAVAVVAPLWAAWLVLGTELLGAVNAITLLSLLLWWLCPLAVAGTLLWKQRRRHKTPHAHANLPPAQCQPWTLLQRLLLAAILFLLTATLLSALFAPPTNFDSLTYHLPRQLLWMQQHNVANFSTNNPRQLMMPPYAEYIGLHLLVLTRSDFLLNLIQWHALLLTLLAASLLTAQLGGSRTEQLFAALFILTIPAAFLQASNTKNDLVEALWCLLAAVWAFRCMKSTSLPKIPPLMLGLSLGAALLTKGTAVPFTAAIALAATLSLLRRFRARASLPLLAMLLPALLLNAPHLARNLQQFHHAVGPETPAEHGYLLQNETYAPRAILSTLARNLAEESTTPFDPLNRLLNHFVATLHAALNLSPSDPRTTYPQTPYTTLANHPHEEDLASSPAHILVLLLTLPLLPLLTKKCPRALLLFAWAALAVLLFSALLRWQPWHVRLLIPPLCLAAPALAIAWTLTPLRSRLLPALALLLLVALLPTFLDNDRPLFGPNSIFTHSRESQRFHWMLNDQPAFEAAAATIAARHPHRVAFATGGNSPDYLLMHLLLTRVHPAPLFSYTDPVIHIPNDPDPLPDILIAKPHTPAFIHRPTATPFIPIQNSPWFTLLVPAAPTSLP